MHWQIDDDDDDDGRGVSPRTARTRNSNSGVT